MKILAIGAHFDDIELGCGGSLLQWKSKGYEIVLFIASQSGYQNAQGKIIRSNDVAYQEGLESSKYLGARLIAGNFPTFELEFNESLNSKLIETLDNVKPDLVLTHWTGDVHHDHRALALASLHCCRHVPKFLMYCSNWYGSDERFDPKFFVDISDTIEKKIELVKIYQSENTRTGGLWLDYVSSYSRIMGLKAGVEYAEGFQLVRWLY